jgi:serine/threonine-protein kinase
MAGGRYQTFGSYILFKEYTGDAFGRLYRAGEFDANGVTNTVFLRLLDGEGVPAREVIEGFETGRKVAHALVAANVAGGAAFTQQDGVPALICEYVPAQPLSGVLQRARAEGFPVPVDNALLILEKLSLALSAALALEVDGVALVHGLLHPGLILVSTDGEGLITGFGVADRLLGILDDPGAVASVHPYIAPEVFLSRTPSKRADVYSLGAILVELLTGQPLPAEPDDRVGILDRAQLPYDERPLPDDIKAVLARAAAARPEDRFSSAADFKKELDRLLYGGAYSPTTFNLALFMDRLFRSDIETEEQDRAAEQKTDVAPYLAPEPELEPELEPEATAPPVAPRRSRKGLWIGAVVLVAATAATLGWYTLTNRPPRGPAALPTPSAAELEAQRLEQERRLQEMVQVMVQEKMAEKEEEIRQELLARQTRIDDLQRRLRESERRARQSELSLEEQRKQQELQQRIAAEEEAQRQQQEELEAERQRLLEEVAPTATATAETEVVAAEPTLPPPAPTPIRPTTPAPPPTPTVVPVLENSFYDPSEVDTLPVVLEEHSVTWPRLALHSRRQGLVIVQATVNAEGRAEEVKVLRADHEGFGIPQAVVDAVRKYHFKPAIKNDVRVKSYVTVTKRYRFRER